MPKLLLEMEVHVYESPIRVRVEMDDGPVSYAELETLPSCPPERCWVSTADKTVRWEYGSHAGDWTRTSADKVTHDEDVRKAMARAARAGLVAAGFAS